MKRLRLATEAEVEIMRAGGDLDPTCQVVALTTQSGSPLAVIRLAIEIDPVAFPTDFPDRLKALFIRDIETHLAAKGVTSYYFNVTASDEAWQKTVLNWGAEQVSREPEIRFKKAL